MNEAFLPGLKAILKDYEGTQDLKYDYLGEFLADYAERLVTLVEAVDAMMAVREGPLPPDYLHKLGESLDKIELARVALDPDPFEPPCTT